MDFPNISINDWLLNEEENLKRLQHDEIWAKIPLVNVNHIHNFNNGALVRFRGMIQDMFGPEYYMERFEARNETTNEITTGTSKYRDMVNCAEGLDVNFVEDPRNTRERHCYVATSVPGLNKWVQDCERAQFAIVAAPEAPSPSQKRPIDEVMDVDGDSTNASGSLPKKVVNNCNESGKDAPANPLFSLEHLLNHPLGDANAKVCHLKVYSEADSLKLNDVCEFVGFLSINPLIESALADTDLESDIEHQIHHPPTSVIPRIHVVHFKALSHLNPLLSGENYLKMGAIRKELLTLLSQLLMGDVLAAEYLICHLISEIYSRRDCVVLGKFSLNLFNVPKLENIDVVAEIYKFLERLVPASHYLPLTLENMNTLSFTPKKDYDCNRLTSGILQLSKNTLLVLDETKLQEGKLHASGIQAVKSLANAIRDQKVAYDFNYYPIVYECDIPFLILSEGRSMLPSDVIVPLAPEEASVETFGEILQAANHFLNPELLADIRKYLTQARLIKYEISEDLQEVVQEEFVRMRQNSNITAEDLHGLLVLARLICLSEGNGQLNVSCWRKACEMEAKRKARLPK